MSFAAHHREFTAFVAVHPEREAPKKPGILRRIFDAFMQSRQRNIDRQIARFLAARSGGTLTDDLEREISQRLLRSNWNVNASPYDNRRFP
jgi:hypothetical protein